jgi:hypothetical protein
MWRFKENEGQDIRMFAAGLTFLTSGISKEKKITQDVFG